MINNPPEIVGLIYKSDQCLWLENGGLTSFSGPEIVLGNLYTIDFNISAAAT